MGISQYRSAFAAPLQGPDDDAAAVRDWLVDEDGGRLPSGNVTCLRTADFAPGSATNPEPASARIRQELEVLAERMLDRPGRRLYLYFSGHGFSPVLEEAAVFTAEASLLSPAHVYVHDYLRWFRKAQVFAQAVLWVDACMNSKQTVPVQELPLRDKIGTAVPGPAFIALAAQTKQALEARMADGRVHGVFTWTLLEGLRGAAANRRGRVTGKSLESYLHNAMADHIPAGARTSSAVDLQPFIRADEGMEFARLPERPRLDVTLRIPAARAGQLLRIWTGSPHRVAVTRTLTGPEWRGGLVRGLYVAEVPDAGLRHGFQVTGAGPVDVTIDAGGPSVEPSDGSGLFRLDVATDNPATTVVVIDDDFQWVVSGTGGLREREAPGVYKVRAQFGRDLTTSSEEIVLLDRDLALDGVGPAPVLSSPAHVGVGSPAGGLHRPSSRSSAAAADGARTADSALRVMVRYEATTPARADLPHPMHGLRWVDTAGAMVAELADDALVRAEQDVLLAEWEKAVRPGTHFLRQELDRGTYEAALTVSPGWLTQLVLRRTAGSGAAWSGDGHPPGHVVEPDDLALFMRRSTDPSAPAGDDVLEAAGLALVHGRDVFADGQGEELRRTLLEEHADPVAGIVGCHLLLRTMAGGRWTGESLAPVLDAAVERLRGMIGRDHPDVEALSLRCADPDLRAAGPFRAPPAFSASWQLIVEASYDRPDRVPIEVWARVHASHQWGPFLVWVVDEDVRSAHLEQLQTWMRSYGTGPDRAAAPRAGGPAPVRAGAPQRHLGGPAAHAPRLPPRARDAARRVGIPATAAADLWAAAGEPA